jgi:hypothetical protein
MDAEIDDDDELEIQDMLHDLDDRPEVQTILDRLIDGLGHQTERRDGEAPTFTIPPRVIGAVEMPAIVKNIDRAEKALGRVSMDWNQV